MSSGQWSVGPFEREQPHDSWELICPWRAHALTRLSLRLKLSRQQALTSRSVRPPVVENQGILPFHEDVEILHFFKTLAACYM